MNLFDYRRRETGEVQIGGTPLGGKHPIRVQSMTNTSTMDTEACVAQTLRIAEAGGDYVRLTTQGVREAENLRNINAGVRAAGCAVPLVADVHFNPKVADVAALYAEKVRINPGNYVDAARTFKHLEYTDEEYAQELKKIEERFVPFLRICRENHTAIRIGVNHGSLRDRIMSRYGDTPAGMVESAMEYLRIFREENFNDVAISIKASNTVIMVETVRRLVAEMDREDMHYPLHLGVTEAGDGEDRRIKSAVGIGTLLAEGIGDTVRVSLSEEPELEIPVARKLVDYITAREGHAPINGCFAKAYNRIAPERRPTNAVGSIGGQNVPVVATALSPADVAAIATKPDFFLSDVNWKAVDASAKAEGFSDDDVLLLTRHHANPVGEIEAFIHRLWDNGCKAPVVVRMSYDDANEEDVQVKAGADFGALLLNGLVDGIVLDAPNLPNNADAVAYSFGILQAARRRTTKTEYISCPSCGRTLYDLQHAVKEIKAATSHLIGLKIGIMGCIVNGPGEMADADYGYVGAAVGKVSLYKGKECVERNVPQDVALTHLIDLIKANGDWTEPKQ